LKIGVQVKLYCFTCTPIFNPMGQAVRYQVKS
jgi:hypothetical protein